ncbi:hypothetical protein WDU94_012531 [Cyamophila willieti]
MLSLQNISIIDNMTITDQKYRNEIRLLKEEITFEKSKPELVKLMAQIQTSLFKLHNKVTNCFQRKELKLAREYIIAMEYYRILKVKLQESLNLMDHEGFGLSLDTW